MRSQALQVAGQIASSKLTSLRNLKGTAHMTHTQEQIEAVARSMAEEKMWPGVWEQMPDYERETFLLLAIAAIAAIRALKEKADV